MAAHSSVTRERTGAIGIASAIRPAGAGSMADDHLDDLKRQGEQARATARSLRRELQELRATLKNRRQALMATWEYARRRLGRPKDPGA
jgi:hypothetical protein